MESEEARTAEHAAKVELEFLHWEAISRDTLDVKRCYIDLAGDLLAGVLLSQIVYWFLPSRKGESKLIVEKDGRRWLVKGRADWWEECRISIRQFDRAIALLEKAGVVETRVARFHGMATKHISVKFESLVKLLTELPKQHYRELPKNGVTELPKRYSSELPKRYSSELPKPQFLFKEITTETTAEITEQEPSTAPGRPATESKNERTEAKSPEAIYTAYPRHVGRALALKSIAAAVLRLVAGEGEYRFVPDQARRFLEQAAAAYARSPAGCEGKFTPHPATWFAQSRYLDDREEWRRGAKHDSPNRGTTSHSAAGARAERNRIAGQESDALVREHFGLDERHDGHVPVAGGEPRDPGDLEACMDAYGRTAWPAAAEGGAAAALRDKAVPARTGRCARGN